MSEPLVAFEDRGKSAADELEAFGDDVAIRFLRFLNRIAGGGEDYRRLQEFAEFRGVPLFKAEFADAFGENVVVYAVEEDEMGDRKVTVMLCIARDRANPEWDRLLLGEALVRAAAWFDGAGE